MSHATMPWDRLTVMLVDDNRFVASLLQSTLRSIGIQNVIIEEDGATAIKRLKTAAVDPLGAGFRNIDLIISDYLMPTVDGMLFLRWLRTGDSVPDRFVPFIMLSGAADRDVVEEGRDAGTTEFLAKPFSVASVAERILQVINKPRRFVLAKGYFGPDRRRRDLPVAEERRSEATDDIEVVHFRAESKGLREDVRAIHFELPNRLREKLGAEAVAGTVAIDPQVIASAEERIQEMAGDYTDWVQHSIDSLVKAHTALAIVSGNELEDEEEDSLRNRRQLSRISRIAHELRGQGGIFDYPLITALGRSLYSATKELHLPVTANRHKLIGAHIDGVKTVFKNKVSGSGGEVGRELLREIASAVQRLT